MELLKTFEIFLIDKIFEDKFEISIVISERLERLLSNVNHDIATDLLNLDNIDAKSNKITLIDYDEDDVTKFTYTIPNKLVDLVSKKTDKNREDTIEYLTKIDAEKLNFLRLARNTQEVWETFRVSASISKVIEKIFPGKYDASKGENSRESFKNIIEAKRKKQKDAFSRFDIVDGYDIVKYYHKDNYEGDKSLGGQLYSSCMRYDECSEYLEFFAKNKDVQMVILMSDDDEDTISGRALLWDIEYINGEEVDRKFMDRIYTIRDADVHLFKDFAEKNGWLYKKNQNMFYNESIVDPVNDETRQFVLKTPSTFRPSHSYPYMDTMKFFYYDERYLTNREEKLPHFFLEDTEGGYGETNTIYVEYYDRYFSEDDDDLIYCEFGDDYRLIDDAVLVSGLRTIEYATKEYAEEHLIYSEYADEYYVKEDAVWSNYHDSYILKNETVKIYTNDASKKPFDEIYQNPHFIDYITKDSISFIEYYKHDMYFSVDDKDDFMLVKSLLKDGNKSVWVHKVWDRDKIFIKDGEYWIHDSTDEDFYSLEGEIKLLGEKKLLKKWKNY